MATEGFAPLLMGEGLFPPPDCEEQTTFSHEIRSRGPLYQRRRNLIGDLHGQVQEEQWKPGRDWPGSCC